MLLSVYGDVQVSGSLVIWCMCVVCVVCCCFFQAEDGIRDLVRSRGLGDVYKRQLLTLPVTLVTLGLFLFVINALMFWAAGGMLGGFHVAGFGAALVGSLIYSLLGVVIDSALQGLFAKS